MSSMIQGIPNELSIQVISFCSNESLTHLSGVNTHLNKFLSNYFFFEDRFKKEHPHLAKQIRVFTTLVASSPANCWKVACRVLELGHFNPNITFLKRVAPFIANRWKSYEEKLQTIPTELYGRANEALKTIYGMAKEPDALETFGIVLARRTLKKEFKEMVKIESSSKDLSLLQECCTLIDEERSPSKENCLARLKSIQYLINSCSDKQKADIWDFLYTKCANNDPEEQWAENHFHEFLEPLKKIVNSAIFGHGIFMAESIFAETNLITLKI